jgi:hypothetical protein
MAQTIYVYLSSGDIATIQGCTGNPTEEVIDFEDGYYRDIFTATGNNTGYYLAGTAGDPTESPKSIAVPGLIHGGGIMIGDPTTGFANVDQEEEDAESKVQAVNIKLTNSDEIAHTALRQITYSVAYWAFPTLVDGTTMNMMFRKTLVKGWSNSAPIDS